MPKDKEKNQLLKLLRIETQMMDEMQEIITNSPRIFACSLIGRR
jgi:predicted P-loop ATPase/GTPase